MVPRRRRYAVHLELSSQEEASMSASQPEVVNAHTTGVIGRIVLAALIDIVVIFCLAIVLVFTVGDTEYSYVNGVYYPYNVIEGAKFYVYLGLILLYFFVSESISGRTLGKRLLKLRVLSLDRTPARPTAIATRSLLRLVDWLPFFYTLGYVFAASTRRHQRLGDLLAKTVVVQQ
jgi:uncharacterized RDD family membrane protein YckC